MKLLIVTQVVDKKHSILGFFHAWIEEFARQCEQVTVICLEAGKHSLPANVEVLSLGKESNASKFRQLLNFYRYVWRERKNYDKVFVHMNPLYVVLAGPLWRLLRKRIGLWYTHGTVSTTLRLATFFTHKVFTASDESFRINTPKKVVTGHGIDTSMFTPTEEQKTIDLITVGRLSPVKNIEVLIKVMAEVRKTEPATLTIVGSAIDEAGKAYEMKLRELASTQGIADYVYFYGPVTPNELPKLLNQAKVFVTASNTGSLDKVMLEAMACGLPVVSMAEGSKSLPLGAEQVNTSEDFATQVTQVLKLGNSEPEDYVKYTKDNHSLKRLIQNTSSHYV